MSRAIQNNRVLITGATGFLGRNLAFRLAGAGYDVVIVKRSRLPITDVERSFQGVAVGALGELSVDDIFAKHGPIDVVVHTATCYGRAGETDREVLESNLMFGIKLLESASRHRVSLFVNADTLLPRDVNRYALSKSNFLEWGRLWERDGGGRFVNVRHEQIYGPGDSPSKFTTWIARQCVENVPEIKLTRGEQRRDFVYIDDVVNAYLSILANILAAKDRFQEFEVGSGSSIPVRRFVESVHRHAGSSSRLVFGAVPYRENEIMDSKPNARGLFEIGWSPSVSLDEGIRLLLEDEKSRKEST